MDLAGQDLFQYLDADDLLVAEKAGLLWDVRRGFKHVKPIIDLQQEILNNGDRGLLSVAVDPQWASNGYIYLLYVVDPNGDGSFAGHMDVISMSLVADSGFPNDPDAVAAANAAAMGIIVASAALRCRRVKTGQSEDLQTARAGDFKLRHFPTVGRLLAFVAGIVSFRAAGVLRAPSLGLTGEPG